MLTLPVATAFRLHPKYTHTYIYRSVDKRYILARQIYKSIPNKNKHGEGIRYTNHRPYAQTLYTKCSLALLLWMNFTIVTPHRAYSGDVGDVFMSMYVCMCSLAQQRKVYIEKWIVISMKLDTEPVVVMRALLYKYVCMYVLISIAVKSIYILSGLL